MVAVAIICQMDQSFVEPALVRATLVAADQHDRLPQGIEREGHPPNFARLGEPQLLHVGVSRSLQGVHRGSAQVRSEFGQQPSVREQFVLQVIIQAAELGVEIIME
jgi:hypothetical protein